MRVLVIIKANKESEAGVMPSEALLNAMGKFNEELVNAGVMLAVKDCTRRRKRSESSFPAATGS